MRETSVAPSIACPDSNVLCQYVHLQTNALHHSEKMDNREMREKSVGLTIACPDT